MTVQPNNSAEQQILRLLKGGPHSVKSLAAEIGMCGSSVRSAVSMLRDYGYVITQIDKQYHLEE